LFVIINPFQNFGYLLHDFSIKKFLGKGGIFVALSENPQSLCASSLTKGAFSHLPPFVKGGRGDLIFVYNLNPQLLRTSSLTREPL